jgi:hypothetical protein
VRETWEAWRTAFFVRQPIEINYRTRPSMQYKAVLRSVKLLCDQGTTPMFWLRGLDLHPCFTCLFPCRSYVWSAVSREPWSGDTDRAASDGDTDMNQPSMFARWRCACHVLRVWVKMQVESASRSDVTRTRDFTHLA